MSERLDLLNKLREAAENALKAKDVAYREELAAFMIRNSFATGHGDTFDDLLGELEWQVKEIIAREREQCALTAMNVVQGTMDGMNAVRLAAQAIRARTPRKPVDLSGPDGVADGAPWYADGDRT